MTYTPIAMFWPGYAFFCAVITTFYAKVIWKSREVNPFHHIMAWLLLPLVLILAIITTLNLLREKNYYEIKKGWALLGKNLMGDYDED